VQFRRCVQSIYKDEIVPGKRVYLLIVASVATLFVIAACSEEAIPTQEPVEFSPTAASSVDRPDDSEKATEPAAEAPIADAGDAKAGQNLFISCGACHSTGDNKVVGPGLAGVYARAGSRTSLDADAYIEQSVREPSAFVVDGFGPLMPSFDYFSDEDVQNVIAYLKTLE
jgi:cytochrome c2